MTEEHGMMQFMGLQRVRRDLVAQQQQRSFRTEIPNIWDLMFDDMKSS